MRLFGIVTLVWAFALLVSTVRLLDCGCANVTVWDFVPVGVFIVAGFALMIKEE